MTFAGDAEAICRANIFLRSAERVLLQVGRFRATTFDELFEGIKALPWEDYIPKDGKFWVKKASSIKSKLFSPSDIQSIAKKAMVERLKNVYRLNWFPEDGAPYPVRIFLLKDEVMVTLDTSGDSPAQERLSSDDQQGSTDGDAGSSTDYADTVEKGPYSGRSVLRKWNVPD